ncbi:MAG: DUF397 domain-containing protein [Frankia sp.]|nr:DUF397 domain-containing protein [Frankia sp.]
MAHTSSSVSAGPPPRACRHSTVRPAYAEHADRLVWERSSFTDGLSGRCVEVAQVTTGPAAGGVFVRDRPTSGGPVLAFSAAEWVAFLDGAENGEFRGR